VKSAEKKFFISAIRLVLTRARFSK
jgi:hypothetical protein